VVLNPVLKDIEFFKIKIPPDTFREIVTFISNVLTNPEKESPPLPNKLKIISKGFDYKTSFRKPKQDKK
jgi:hypothetical protein